MKQHRQHETNREQIEFTEQKGKREDEMAL